MDIDFGELNELLEMKQDTLDELKEVVELLDDNSNEQAFERVYQLVKKIEVQDKVLPYINRVLLIMLDTDMMVMQ